MTLKQPIGRTRVLRCDHYGCERVFEGVSRELTPLVRGRARMAGWRCWNPGPQRPARDLCPEHAGEAS